MTKWKTIKKFANNLTSEQLEKDVVVIDPSEGNYTNQLFTCIYTETCENFGCNECECIDIEPELMIPGCPFICLKSGGG